MQLEKILEEIERNRKQTAENGNFNVAAAYEECMNIIRKHMNDDWIPVENALPEADSMVLVTCRTKKGIMSVNRAYCDGMFWHGTGSMSGVIAWRPLPDPYHAERSRE